MNTTVAKTSLADRINLRMIGFAAIVLFLLGWPIYTFVSESLTHGIHNRGAYKEVDLKAMGFFEIDPVNASPKDVPAQYRALDGQKVKLTGEIVPLMAARGKLSEFTLVYSIQKCCYGGPPKVQERVFASVAPDKNVEFSGDGYHDVVGTLHVTMKRDQEKVIEVYHLDVDSMKPSK